MKTQSGCRFFARLVVAVFPAVALAGFAVTAEAMDEIPPTARGDTYATPVGKTLTVDVSRVSGVLYNDFDTDEAGNNIGNDGLTAVLVSGPSNGTLSMNSDGKGGFEYTPTATLADNDNDSFTYQAKDDDGNLSDVTTVNIHILSNQPDFKIMMNYELGMHCTGFEFSYCCVLPPYNSILAQVVKPQSPGEPQSNADFPRLLEGDPNHGLDALGRETVLRDYDGEGGIQKYYLEYYHDAQPRREGNMPGTFNDQTSTLISDAEGNGLLYHNTPYDSAMVDADGKLVTGNYDNMSTGQGPMTGVVQGDGDYTDATDNYANGWLNHFYIYQDLEGTIPIDPATGKPTTLEKDKIRLGVAGMVEYPKNVGAALQPMGPAGNVSGFDNVLTFSGDTGTVVYTQMKVLENLPVMLTSPRIWEALGLPLTPFEDSIDFFGNPGAVDEDSVRPFVAMKARLRKASCNEGNEKCNKGPVVIGSNGKPVIGFGTAPIDIPNCERCHAAPAFQPDANGDPDPSKPNINSPSYVRDVVDNEGPVFGPTGMTLEAITDLEIEYWDALYPSLTTGSNWYARLKGAAVNMLAQHDFDLGTRFLANYPGTGSDAWASGLPASKQIPQNTRMGHEAVICQKCHADNVIAVVKSAIRANGRVTPPISDRLHRTHRNKSEGGEITFNDGLGRDGGCQGCHPAHRSDGTMDNYPIDRNGNNAQANSDNRLALGGCFVGRDVHSNPMKDVDGAETPAHLNAVGTWLSENVFRNQAGEPGGNADTRGVWCTNCHNQLSQELWRTEDCNDLIHGDCLPNANPRAAGPDLQDVFDAINAGRSAQSLPALSSAPEDYLDPKVDGFNMGSDLTHLVWSSRLPEQPSGTTSDANVATIEVDAGGNPVVTTDADGDVSVNVLSFCTTVDCVAGINANKADKSQWRYPANAFIDPDNNSAAAVPFNAATDGRDFWLAAGEPHCADCHAAPFTEQSGNINPFPPFNYPAKASLMRYSRGHQDLGCQACHESIHGLYPVTAAIDNTSYAQAAALNADGSHGPLKCGTCHQVGSNGIPTWITPADEEIEDNPGGGVILDQINNNNPSDPFDGAVTWAHTYTDEANVLDTTCQNCHGVWKDGPDDWDVVNATEEEYLEHAMIGRTSRRMMDKAEIKLYGHVLGTTPDERQELCTTCHEEERRGSKPNYLNKVKNCGTPWTKHLTQGRVSQSVWEDVTEKQAGNLCGW